MNTFWGCTTDDMDGWAELASGHAATLTAVLDDLGAAGPALTWFGPDAQQFQDQLDAWLIAAYETAGRVVELLELIRAEAGQQEEASAPDPGGASGDRGSPVPSAPAPFTPAPSFGPGSQNPFGPMIDPLWKLYGDRLRKMVDGLGGAWGPQPWWNPVLADPSVLPGGASPLPPISWPAGGKAPQIGLADEELGWAEGLRTAGAKSVPGLKQVQLMMAAHGAMGDGIDRVEQGMEEAGYGQYTGALAPVRIAHATSGLVIGENSVAGQVLGGVDAQLANTIHTTGAVSEALLDGDLVGAVRETEHGMMRHAESQIDILTANPLPAVVEFASTTVHAGADYIEPFAPAGTADALRDAADRVDGHAQGVGAAWDEATSAQTFLDLRHRYLPMPWDQAS